MEGIIVFALHLILLTSCRLAKNVIIKKIKNSMINTVQQAALDKGSCMFSPNGSLMFVISPADKRKDIQRGK